MRDLSGRVWQALGLDWLVGVMPTPLHTPILKELISSQSTRMLSTWGLGKPAQSLLLPLNRGILYDYNNKVAAHNEHLQTNILEMV